MGTPLQAKTRDVPSSNGYVIKTNEDVVSMMNDLTPSGSFTRSFTIYVMSVLRYFWTQTKL